MDTAPTPTNKSAVGRVIAVVVMGLALYVVLPALVRVVDSWPRLFKLEPWWLLLGVGAEFASFFCAMALLRLVLRSESWFTVVTAALAGKP